MFELGPLRLDLINDGLFELKPETFVKLSRGRHRKLLDKSRFRPRIRVSFNTLLIRGSGHTVLIDPGTGDKPLGTRVREYNMEWPRKLPAELDRLGVRPADVDTVILTHLHWDHAGGSTTVGYSGQIEPAFPQATYYLQKRELDAAREAILTQDDGYLSDDFEPLIAASQLELIETDEFEIFPWLRLHWTGGHCSGHQLAVIGTPGEARAIYFSDLIPTTSQIPMDHAMSYDVKYDQLAAAKKRFLDEAADGNYLAMFVHAPRSRAGYIRRVEHGQFEFEAVKM